jgi:hypothetical protein
LDIDRELRIAIDLDRKPFACHAPTILVNVWAAGSESASIDSLSTMPSEPTRRNRVLPDHCYAPSAGSGAGLSGVKLGPD